MLPKAFFVIQKNNHAWEISLKNRNYLDKFIIRTSTPISLWNLLRNKRFTYQIVLNFVAAIDCNKLPFAVQYILSNIWQQRRILT